MCSLIHNKNLLCWRRSRGRGNGLLRAASLPHAACVPGNLLQETGKHMKEEKKSFLTMLVSEQRIKFSYSQ